jgi:hypothetical protein
MSKYKNISYSVFGGGGAAGSILAGQGCLGSCAGCFSCVAFAGTLVGLALVKNFKRTKEDKNGMATAEH